MQPLDKQVSRRLTKLYLLALIAIALLLSTGQILIQNFLSKSLDDAHVVNIAGRQRMLSQYICKTTILLTHPAITKADTTDFIKTLHETLTIWKQSQDELRKGKLVIHPSIVTAQNSDIIDSMFQLLQPTFLTIYQNAQLINKSAEKPELAAKINNEVALSQILKHEQAYLAMMNKIVFQYDLEAQARVNRLKNIEWTLFLLTLLVIFMEGLLIFRPLVMYVQKIIKILIVSEANLQKANVDLTLINEKLVATQADLLKATEGKFDRQRQEDNIRSSSLLEGQEEERKRISLELHDGIGQMLTGLKLGGERLKSFPFANEKQRKALEDHQKLIDETIEVTRTISFNLMPSVLSDFGLGSALRLLVDQTVKTSDMKIVFKNDYPASPRLPNTIEINIYRIAQEALNNAIKYADAKQIEVTLWKEHKNICLRISDDGKGFQWKKHKSDDVINNGLKNMETRVRLINGSFKIHSEMGKGTEILTKLAVEG